MKLQDLRQNHEAALTKAESFINSADAAGRAMNATEVENYNTAMAEAREIGHTIKTREAQSTIRGAFGDNPLDIGRPNPGAVNRGQKPMTKDYGDAFLGFLRSGGKQATRELSEGFDPLFGGFALPAMPGMSSALYGGSSGSSTTAGGYAVSVPTDNLIVPLATPDLGVRSLARAIPTANDIKIPTQTAFSSAGIKAESGSSTNNFTESDPTLGQFTLSAFMVGLYALASWEILQDVERFQTFVVNDLLSAVDVSEDGYFVSGSGSGQPQGLLGNVGTGTASPYAVESTGAYLLEATLDVMGTLKAGYQSGAAFLMSRATATAIRRAQLQANLFAPVFTSEGGRDYLHGRPVAYSGTMPSIPTTTNAGVTPILFGSFSDGYVIGDRGGSGTFVKILDQPYAVAGQTALLAYKRVDGRVRRSEAIQGVSISHS